VSEPSSESLWSRGLAYATKNKSRLARFAVLIVLIYAVTDLLGSAPQDATLSLPLDELRGESRAVAPTDEVEITILEHDGTEPLTHTRAHVDDELRDLRHAVHLAPGHYDVHVEMRGASPRVGHFEIPADGVVRVQLSPAP
jgi:hypothetical protein